MSESERILLVLASFLFGYGVLGPLFALLMERKRK